MNKKVVIIGGGFGGLQAAKGLKNAPLQVTLIDKENHHLFQPLLYQVATASLVPGQIAFPIRSALRENKNTQVLLGTVIDVDLSSKTVALNSQKTLPFDYLVIATGSETNYFGHDAWENHSIGLKDIRDSLQMREKILRAFEQAEMNPEQKGKLLSFIVIGGGPTGVELAGAISELGRTILAGDFRNIHPEDVQVTLVEGAPQILGAFDPKLSEKARKDLETLGVKVLLNSPVEQIHKNQVFIAGKTYTASVICWATGVKPSSLLKTLDVEKDASGRIRVDSKCNVAGKSDVFVIGDAASFTDPKTNKPLPGLAPVATQQGRYVAKSILKDLRNKKRNPFAYIDKGIMATIGRSRAVVQSKGLKLTGFFAWLAWIFVHIWFLIGFKNRIFVLLEWFWAFVTFRRGSRLITSRPELSSPNMEHTLNNPDNSPNQTNRPHDCTP